MSERLAELERLARGFEDGKVVELATEAMTRRRGWEESEKAKRVLLKPFFLKGHKKRTGVPFGV